MFTKNDFQRMEQLANIPEEKFTDAMTRELESLDRAGRNELAQRAIETARLAEQYGYNAPAVELPEYDTLQLMREAVQKLAGGAVDVVIAPTPPGEAGYTWRDPSDQAVKIVIGPHMFDNWGGLLSTLLHEAAHAKLHPEYLERDLTEAQKRAKETGRVEAEARHQGHEWQRYAEANAGEWAVKAATVAEARFKACLLSLIYK